MAIDSTTRIIRTPNLASCVIDADLVILNLSHNNYTAFDAIGRRIWDLIESPRRVDELCRQLSEEFDGVPDEIAADVLRFLNELEDEQLVKIAEEGSS